MTQLLHAHSRVMHWALQGGTRACPCACGRPLTGDSQELARVIPHLHDNWCRTTAMEPLLRLGRTLATLRSIRGLSVDEAASQAGLDSHQLREAEAGRVTESVRECLAKYYGLDVESLVEGLAIPALDQDVTATVFLLHGANQDFAPADWSVLERAMQSARLYATRTTQGRNGVRERQGFLPVRPAGPLRRDAAMQGHKLARQVRARLQLGGEPLGDLRPLIEERLGVVVVVDALATLNLRAASILDVARVGAAAVLSNRDEARERNPLLNRVYLAHELCHLLFDPGAPGCVQIALDDQPQGRRSSSLLESRAKGFAAEFLLPRMGVEALLGSRSSPESSRARARALVERATEHFGTPWEITARHLGNLRFLTEGIAGEIVQEGGPQLTADTTTLPSSGQPPFSLSVFGSQANTPSAPSDTPPQFVLEARALGNTLAVHFIEELLASTYAEVQAGRPRAATDLLLERLDALLGGNELERAQLLLERLDVKKTPPEVLTAVLSLVRHAREALGHTWDPFFKRAMHALEDPWGVSEERRRRIEARLG